LKLLTKKNNNKKGSIKKGNIWSALIAICFKKVLKMVVHTYKHTYTYAQTSIQKWSIQDQGTSKHGHLRK
jgi:hypothetical protein